MEWLETLRRSFLDFDAMASVLPSMFYIGLKNTIILAAFSTFFGVLIGIVLAVMGISRSPWLKLPARIYTDIFRGLPATVTILLIGQGFARIGRELFGPSPFPLGIAALSLIAGAYIGEIFRSGIQSVDKGQMEASRALSMSYGQGMRLIVIPQGYPPYSPRPRQPIHRQRQGLKPCLLSGLAYLPTRSVPRWSGSGCGHRESLAAAPGWCLLFDDHGATHPSGQLYRPQTPNR